MEENEGGIGVEFVDQNVEVLCSEDSGRIGKMFEDKEIGEARAMDVDNADSGRVEIEKEQNDEVVDRIEGSIENGLVEKGDGVNEGCENVLAETEEPKDLADRIENSLNEGCKIEFEETEVPKDVPDRIGRVIKDEVSVNEFEEMLKPQNVLDQIDE